MKSHCDIAFSGFYCPISFTVKPYGLLSLCCTINNFVMYKVDIVFGSFFKSLS